MEAALADQLGIDRWAGVVGGSMGGMRVLEWCVGHPDRVDRAVVLAVGAMATAEQIALCSLQIRAITSDPAFAGGDYYATGDRPGEPAWRSPAASASSATGPTPSSRAVSAAAPRRRRTRCKGGRFAVESYLEYHGDKLARRFDPNSYIVLSEAMNHHDVGRGRTAWPGPWPVSGPRWPWPASAPTASTPSACSTSWPGCSPADRPVTVIESLLGPRRVPAGDRAGRAPCWPRSWPESQARPPPHRVGGSRGRNPRFAPGPDSRPDRLSMDSPC